MVEDGYYIYCDLGWVVYFGIYELGFFVVDVGFILDEVQEILVELDQFVLLEIEVKLVVELCFECQLVMCKGWFYFVIVLVIVVGVVFGSNLVLVCIYDVVY